MVGQLIITKKQFTLHSLNPATLAKAGCFSQDWREMAYLPYTQQFQDTVKHYMEHMSLYNKYTLRENKRVILENRTLQLSGRDQRKLEKIK